MSSFDIGDIQNINDIDEKPHDVTVEALRGYGEKDGSQVVVGLNITNGVDLHMSYMETKRLVEMLETALSAAEQSYPTDWLIPKHIRQAQTILSEPMDDSMERWRRYRGKKDASKTDG